MIMTTEISQIVDGYKQAKYVAKELKKKFSKRFVFTKISPSKTDVERYSIQLQEEVEPQQLGEYQKESYKIAEKLAERYLKLHTGDELQ